MPPRWSSEAGAPLLLIGLAVIAALAAWDAIVAIINRIT